MSPRFEIYLYPVRDFPYMLDDNIFTSQFGLHFFPLLFYLKNIQVFISALYIVNRDMHCDLFLYILSYSILSTFAGY